MTYACGGPDRADIPVFSECVIGYRSFRIADWVLAPISYGNPWRPGVNHAICRIGEVYRVPATTTGRGFWTVVQYAPESHDAPFAPCQCGLYALHELPARNMTSWFPDPIVMGAVAAWGNLEVHRDGFRAEYAQIVALVEPTGFSAGGDLAKIAELYGVPVVHKDLIVAEAERHGAPLPVSMRPPIRTLADEMLAELQARQRYRIQMQQLTTKYTPGSLLGALKPPTNRQGPNKPKRPPRQLP